EPGVLHHDRAPACQISRRPIAEPTGVGLNEDVLANTELSLRTGNVIAKCVERKSDTVRIANSPSGTLQLRPWHIAASDCYFQRVSREGRKFEKLCELGRLGAIPHAVPLNRIVRLPTHYGGERSIPSDRLKGEQ